MADDTYRDHPAGGSRRLCVASDRGTRDCRPADLLSATEYGDIGMIGPRNESLTRREAQVLALVGQGLTNCEIADELAIGKRTVEKHISRIFAKLSVSTRPKAMLYAIRNGLVTL